MTPLRPDETAKRMRPENLLTRAELLEREFAYWEKQFEPAGENHEFVMRRLDPARRVEEHPAWIDDYVRWLGTAFPGETLRALDVGSGPLTNLAHSHETGQLSVVATDPLAEAYEKLLEHKGHAYPVLPVAVAGEQLLDAFDKASFHVVYTRNALDHVDDVMAALRSIDAVLKPGGIFFHEGAAYEGMRRQYSDLHKYDFLTRDGRFHVQDHTGAEQLRLDELDMRLFKVWPETAEPPSERHPNDWIHVFFQKEPCSGSDPLYEPPPQG